MLSNANFNLLLDLKTNVKSESQVKESTSSFEICVYNKIAQNRCG